MDKPHTALNTYIYIYIWTNDDEGKISFKF